MAEPRAFLLVLILLFLLLSPEPQQGPLGQRRYELSNDISDQQVALNVLSSSQYGDLDPLEQRWLNLTGLREQNDLSWNQLALVKERSRAQVQHALGEQSLEKLEKPTEASIPLFHNVTGYVRGEWIRSKIEQELMKSPDEEPEEEDEAPSAEYYRNITGSGGKVRFRFKEQIDGYDDHHSGQTYPISAHMAIQDDTSYGDGWELTLHGVHFPDLGSILLTTTSHKLSGIFALPHFAWSEYTFERARQTLNQTLRNTIEEQKSRVNPALNPWTSFQDNNGDDSNRAPHCEFLVYLQQYPVYGNADNGGIVPQDSAILQSVEIDLRFPHGMPMPAIPKIRMSMVAFSPDCGFVIESRGPPDYAPQDSDHLEGSKMEIILNHAKQYSLVFAVVLTLQLILSMRQMKDASTPSTRSRISFYTIAALAMGDGFACLTFLTLAVFLDAIWLVSMTTAFLAFLSVSFFGMRFLMDIWSVQAPERRRLQAQTARNNMPTTTPNQSQEPQSGSQSSQSGSQSSQSAPAISPADADSLPLPITARQVRDSGATPVILPPDQDEAPAQDTDTGGLNTTAPNSRQEFGALYVRFCLLLLFISFLSINATSWPVTLRSAYSNLLSFVYLSFLSPQIYRNIMRNCRKALRWEFVIGQSILRLLPIMYFYAVPDNVPFVENDLAAAAVLVGWVWIQIVVLVCQEVVGPRFFVREGWAPPAYDYHPIIRQDEEGATMPIGFTEATEASDSPTTRQSSEVGAKGKRVFDCAICMQDIEVPMVTADGISTDAGATTLGGGLLARRAYMMTPCRHIFHTPCLEGWMRYRLQCPICRETLPPL
ncbi:MAG: mitofusin [Bathelium mastoideum]|nr:MAG: mitofusin [Bathelium mastoideum]KAI9687782.1 MAG: mitofusin [Bathelium mastoideum]